MLRNAVRASRRIAASPFLRGASVAPRAAAAWTPRVAQPIITCARPYSTPQDDMFCFQCEQTNEGTGCTTVGVCGKTPEVAWAQDLLVEQLKNVAAYTHAAVQLGVETPPDISKFAIGALFATLTNVNFDAKRFKEYLEQAIECEKKAKQLYMAANGGKDDIGLMTKVDLSQDLSEQGRKYGVAARGEKFAGNADAASVVELITYGLKGMAAYADHASQLGYEDPSIFNFVFEALDKIRVAEQEAPDLNALLGTALAVGAKNAEVMALLDKAHTAEFGTPSPAKANRSPSAGKAILVSGHDLGDLRALLEQTEGTGVNVYTHGEMLPAHGYPELRKFSHLKGNYGGPWQQQNFDFSMFPGPVLITTNCLVEPRKGYRSRIYTTNAVGFDGITHVKERDFSAIVAQAQQLEGFTEDETPQYLDVGFGHATVLSLADTIVQMVKDKKISRFFFIGGCDGSEGERSYFTKLAKETPKDSVILTAGCGKYRFNHLPLGELGDTGLPRVLDMGQCNDSFGAVKVAMALADAFDTDVNGIPLSLAVSWFEQKAVAVLLTLLHLNVKNIRLGPALPAFITPNVLNILVDNYGIKPIGNPKEDLKAMMLE